MRCGLLLKFFDRLFEYVAGHTDRRGRGRKHNLDSERWTLRMQICRVVLEWRASTSAMWRRSFASARTQATHNLSCTGTGVFTDDTGSSTTHCRPLKAHTATASRAPMSSLYESPDQLRAMLVRNHFSYSFVITIITRRAAVYLETHCNIGSKRAFPTGVLDRWHNCLLIYWPTTFLVPAFDYTIVSRACDTIVMPALSAV